MHEELFVAVREAQAQVGDALAHAGDRCSSTARGPIHHGMDAERVDEFLVKLRGTDCA